LFAMLRSLLLLASFLLPVSYNNPAASAVAINSADGVPWVPAVVVVSAIAGVPAADVLFATVFPKFLASLL
jgi:hypothetical protein